MPGFLPGAEHKDPETPNPTSHPAGALVMTELLAANERVGLVLPAEFRSHSAS